MTNTTQLENLVSELIALPGETEWVEFKHNNINSQEIGEYLSALANSAALHEKNCAYILWGIHDGTREIVGTSFRPSQAKVGNEELENWLLRLLEPRIDVKIHEVSIEGKPLVIFEVQSASTRPVRFKGVEYFRIGSYKKKLHEFPEKERKLWKVFERTPFENAVVKHGVSADEVLSLIDYPKYFSLMNQPLPENRTAILDRLMSEKIVVLAASGNYDISNVGAVLFARNLGDFQRLARKALRVIIYRGTNRVETIKEHSDGRGYAVAFARTIAYINDQLPQNEQIGQALRQEVRMYPEIAIRELVANALIHQDFSITGAGPTVEIFAERMEITNPGLPLIDTLRFLDEPPRSRNEMLGSLMRRMHICEERGSGIDKVIFNVEAFQLPAPDFRLSGSSTVAVLFAPREFSQMDRMERVRACYQHACLQYVSGNRMANATLRKRLGVKDSNYPMVSRIIKDTMGRKLIKPHSEHTGSRKDTTYVPFWA